MPEHWPPPPTATTVGQPQVGTSSPAAILGSSLGASSSVAFGLGGLGGLAMAIAEQHVITNAKPKLPVVRARFTATP